jgi:hypothetical protein
MTDSQRTAEIKQLEQMMGAPAHNRSGRDPRFSVMGIAFLVVLLYAAIAAAVILL